MGTCRLPKLRDQAEKSEINSKLHNSKMDFFGKKPTVKEQLKENEKALRKVNRDVERDRRELEREEKKLEAEIKKAAKMGNKQAATVLAKQLINVRKQKTRTYNMNSKVRNKDTSF